MVDPVQYLQEANQKQGKGEPIVKLKGRNSLLGQKTGNDGEILHSEEESQGLMILGIDSIFDIQGGNATIITRRSKVAVSTHPKPGATPTVHRGRPFPYQQHDPKAPQKPLMPYNRYTKKVYDQVKAAHPNLKIWEISKVIGQMWSDAPEVEKQPFINDYEADKSKYEESLKNYYHNNSTK